ncbi:MAG: hypothetical protein JXB35_01165 [Anaerolineae bacterium]|nr:hypothetical protein [Anaerolineae bacterium]
MGQRVDETKKSFDRTLIAWLKVASNFIVHHKGLPVLLGVGLIMVNFILQLLPPWPVVGWLARVDLLLHLGLIVAFLGILIGDAV